LQLKDLNPNNLAGLGWAFSIRLILGSVLIGGLLAVASGVVYRQWLQHRRRRLATPPQ
jgi:Leu/Phe-tRNA-protein transferase